MKIYLEFEKPIENFNKQIEILKSSNNNNNKICEEIASLESKSKKLFDNIFSNLTDWQIIQLARHPQRPHGADYLNNVFTDFQELHGDRLFGDDTALVGGLAKLNNIPVMVMAQQKGRNTKEKIYHNFGMMHPEGYRKALRLFKMAEKFKIPVITIIDTPGAYPGIQAEQRGQSEAIATNLKALANLNVPVISLVIGEGCSGGALGLGVADRFLMLEYSYFATISPEGCATILWKTADKASLAAEVMNITATKLLEIDMVDRVIREPKGGAHNNSSEMSDNIRKILTDELNTLNNLSLEEMKDIRYKKFMNYGKLA